jgi:hypothetical protein
VLRAPAAIRAHSTVTAMPSALHVARQTAFVYEHGPKNRIKEPKRNNFARL